MAFTQAVKFCISYYRSPCSNRVSPRGTNDHSKSDADLDMPSVQYSAVRRYFQQTPVRQVLVFVRDLVREVKVMRASKVKAV